jgi:hypothetical protein
MLGTAMVVQLPRRLLQAAPRLAPVGGRALLRELQQELVATCRLMPAFLLVKAAAEVCALSAVLRRWAPAALSL